LPGTLAYDPTPFDRQQPEQYADPTDDTVFRAGRDFAALE
jgi:hypothetical protein